MDYRSRQGHRLLQIGVAFLLFSSFEGFAIPYLASARLGLSVHTLSALLSVLLMTLGLLWPRLRISVAASRVAFCCLIYSAIAIVAAYLIGAVCGAGNSTMRLAAGTAHGSAAQEIIIAVVAYSSAPTGILSFILIFQGLRLENPIAKADAAR